MFKNFDFKNEIQGFEFITKINEKTKNFKSADEIYRVTFDKTKNEYKDSEISVIKNEKRKFDLQKQLRYIDYNNLKTISINLLGTIISICVSSYATILIDETFLIRMLIAFVPIYLIFQLYKNVKIIVISTNNVEKKIIILDAIINALEELIEEKQNQQQKLKKNSNKNVKPKPRRKRK